MAYEYTHFIPQNTAPKEALRIAVYDGNGNRVGRIPLGKLKPPADGKLYSFGLVSDIHLDGIDIETESGTYFDETLTFFESQGCSFCCHAGDITNVGFWSSTTATETYLPQMTEYKAVIDSHPDLPVHGICGNHESYYKPITENLAELKAYTYRDLYYTYEHGNDVFIFLGQPGGTMYVQKSEWINELQWLYETLEANRNKRCFVFTHPTLSDDSGNPEDIHNANWYTLEATLVGIMKHYKNAILFHGHSHLYFSEQEKWSYAHYSTKKGFKSVSIPSSSGSRTYNTQAGKLNKNDAALRSGYIADVYENYVVLNGYNFHTMQRVPIGTYRIDTVLKTVPANTFTDPTGIVLTEPA